MRAGPRLVPSARIAADMAGLSAVGLPVRKWVKCAVKPVHWSTSANSSVIRNAAANC